MMGAGLVRLCRPIQSTWRDRWTTDRERAGGADRIGPHHESGDRVLCRSETRRGRSGRVPVLVDQASEDVSLE